MMNGTTTKQDYESTLKRLEKEKERLKEAKNKLSQKMEENDRFYETVGKLEKMALEEEGSAPDLEAQRVAKEQKAKEIEKLIAEVNKLAVECRHLEDYAEIQKCDVERRKLFNKRPDILCMGCSKPYRLTRLGQSRRLNCSHVICTACALPQVEAERKVTCPVCQGTEEVEEVEDLPLDHISARED